MYNTVKAFRAGVTYLRKTVYAELPSQQIELLLTVAVEEGTTQQDLAQVLSMPQGSLSRNLKQLGSYIELDAMGKKVVKGYGLVESKPDLYSRKQLAVFLTSKGKRVIEGLASVMAEEVE